MGSNAPFVLRWSSLGTATGWTAIGLPSTAGGSVSASGLSVTTDNDNNLYLGGFYLGTGSTTTNGTYGLYNFSSVSIFPTSSLFNLPPSVGQNAFLAKWSSGGLLQSATVLDRGSISSSGLSLVADGDNSIYMSGSYNNTSTNRVVYNFFTGQSAGAFSSGWTSPFSLPVSLQNDPFLIKWNSSGTATAWTTLQDTGTGQKSGIAIDKYNNVHLTGYFLNTSTALPVYNMSSNSTAGANRYSFVATTTNNASFYTKYSASGLVDLSPYSESFYVQVPNATSTSQFKKTIVLKTQGYQYRIIASGSTTIIPINNNVVQVDLLWDGSSWSII
jgi:hypothetical protein